MWTRQAAKQETFLREARSRKCWALHIVLKPELLSAHCVHGLLQGKWKETTEQMNERPSPSSILFAAQSHHEAGKRKPQKQYSAVTAQKSSVRGSSEWETDENPISLQVNRSMRYKWSWVGAIGRFLKKESCEKENRQQTMGCSKSLRRSLGQQLADLQFSGVSCAPWTQGPKPHQTSDRLYKGLLQTLSLSQ